MKKTSLKVYSPPRTDAETCVLEQNFTASVDVQDGATIGEVEEEEWIVS